MLPENFPFRVWTRWNIAGQTPSQLQKLYSPCFFHLELSTFSRSKPCSIVLLPVRPRPMCNFLPFPFGKIELAVASRILSKSHEKCFNFQVFTVRHICFVPDIPKSYFSQPLGMSGRFRRMSMNPLNSATENMRSRTLNTPSTML